MSSASGASPGLRCEVGGVAQVALCAACLIFSLQAAAHWLNSVCSVRSSRRRQHEVLSTTATGWGSLCYLSAACGISLIPRPSDAEEQRCFFWVLYAGRAGAVSLSLVNLCTLARERRPPTLALASLWCSSVSALYLGNMVVASGSRAALFAAALALLLPLATTLVASGERLRMSELLATYRFLSNWSVLCGLCYCFVFLSCEVVPLLADAEVLLHALLDLSAVGVPCLVISCAGPDAETPVLPAQERELALYQGPAQYGFYPNFNYYDDNL